jgi:hypothetical protein
MFVTTAGRTNVQLFEEANVISTKELEVEIIK